ncbi:substrate-binding domain-containing protein [Stappia stellulata]|uniref:substrate-binding domain-containing protein n=1 Tax=Stappia stellulata TaxID=71235 RepID=UPI0004272928|nr:substrate-binding domain-containing protein [Stappia stellulata]
MNLRELSAHLGLSQTTVSRALNGYGDVAPATRRKVVEAAERVGYRPNSGARRLATGRSQALGIAFPVDRNLLLDPHFIEFIAGVAAHAGEQGYDLTVSPTTGTEGEVYRRFARMRTADAVILSGPVLEDPRIALLRGLQLPFVVHGRTQTPLPYAFVDIDNHGAFRQACQLLLDLGHRRIGLINGDESQTFARDRRAGWSSALMAAGLVAATDGLARAGAMTEENGYRFARDLLETSPRPTGLICSSVLLAFGAYRAVRDLGLAVGRDVSVIGHDDELPFLRPHTLDPPLTVTRSPIRKAGERVADFAIRLATGTPIDRLAEIKPVDLVYRGSTAAPEVR